MWLIKLEVEFIINMNFEKWSMCVENEIYVSFLEFFPNQTF